MANYDSEKSATDRQHESYADDAKAQRVLMVGSSGTVADVVLGRDVVNENVETTWAITRGDGQPDTESIYSSTSGTHTRTFTYDSNNFMIKRTAWVKQ